MVIYQQPFAFGATFPVRVHVKCLQYNHVIENSFSTIRLGF